ncbi:ATP-binding protein [Pseudonocardia acaciae]|uniref:ATP-binding protein n=1 Tax=Pseudonocardia acaciae TaxID=551276 RepID=UPI00048FB836|nr:ATP-binding protein [Pseudonocardia acaciae]
MKTPAVLAGWWARRSLRVRITVAVAGVAMLASGALAWVATGLVGITITGAVDVELARAAATAVGRLSAGVPEDSVVPGDASLDGVSGEIHIRVSDTAGRPLDDGRPLPLSPELLRRLASGDSVTEYGPGAPTRWLGVSAIAPDGSPRLVLAAADLVGYSSVLRRGAIGLSLAAVLAAFGVSLAAWTAVGLALRPVGRMRSAAASLPPGERLPVPPATDELRSLAEELNELLARRDSASARLERFTGDAAHELRSPVAAIRAQAEVAVMHPDPALAEDTLRSVATEAARLSELLSDLLALARADAGARPPATAVDMVAEASTAIARATQTSAPEPAPGPAVTLTAPVPVWAAASPGEVALVLDNLLANACRYARSRVRVSVLPAGRAARLVVDDDGPGVPEADQQRVFDRFTRLEADRGGVSGGAGLGLALVSALVTGRSGTVRMSTAPDGGARVEARWPAATPPDDSIA